MNKSNHLQYTIYKPNSKEYLKQKLKDIDNKSKKYDSMSHDIDDHLYSIIPKDKQRKVSKKQLKNTSPSRINRSKSAKYKKNDNSTNNPLHTQNSSKNIGDLYYQLMLVKSQYKNLKLSYSKLMQQKTQLTVRQQTQRATNNLQLQKCNKQIEKYQKYNKQLQGQIDRLKRQCYRVMQLQKFKNKKLQEIIQQKDLMIAFLRNQIQKQKDKGRKNNQSIISTCANQSNLSFLKNTSPIYPFDYVFKSTVSSSIPSLTSSLPIVTPSIQMNNVIIEQNTHQNIKIKKNDTNMSHDEDSLSFSRDKSKQIDSFNSFLTINQYNTKVKAKKDLVIINSSDQMTQNEQDKDNYKNEGSVIQECPTFDNRQQQQKNIKKSVRKSQKMFNLPINTNQKSKISQSLQPPRDFKKQKTKISTKLLQITTDENNQFIGNKSSISLEHKKSNANNSQRIKKMNQKQVTFKKKK